MQPFDPIRLRLSAGAAAVAALLSTPALACSDLPNICAMNAQHHQNMMDIAATPQWDYDESYGEGYYYDDYSDSYSDYPSSSYDPTQVLLSASRGVSAAMQQPTSELEERLKDPKFREAYERYQAGGWEYFQDHADAPKGQYCAAFFTKGEGMVRLSGPGGDYQGALITFWGPGIPSPDTVKTIKVTLDQADGAPQAVQAFNYKIPGDAYGAIAFAVPSIEAALEGMLDKQSFELLIKGKSVARVEWHDGLKARKQIEKCLRAG